MKWLWFLIGFMVFLPNVFAANLVVSAGDSSGQTGELAKIPINLQGASNVGSMDITLTYDSRVLNAVSVENGPLGESAFMEANTENDGVVAIALADSSGISGDGVIAIVSVNVIGETGSTSEIGIEALAYDANTMVDIITSKESGNFTVEEKGSGFGGKGIITVIIIVIIIIISGLIIKGKKK